MNWIAGIILPDSQTDRKLLTESTLGLPNIERLIKTLQKAGAHSVRLLHKGRSDLTIDAAVQKAGGLVESLDSFLSPLCDETVLLLDPLGFPDEEWIREEIEKGERITIYKTALGETPIALIPNTKIATLRESSGSIEAIAQGPDIDMRSLKASHWLPLGDAKTEEQLLKRLVKPNESFLARKFERRISLAITRRWADTSITPNQISFISLVIGFTSTLGFLSPNRLWNTVGALLLLSHSIIDGCDGELSRLNFKQTRFGAWLDFIGDNVIHFILFWTMAIGLYRGGMSGTILWAGGLAAFGTGMCAFLIFYNTVRVKGFFASVSANKKPLNKRAQTFAKIADSLGNRDFIYVILLLAVAGKLHWFLWATAIGSNLYPLLLTYIYSHSQWGKLH